MRRPGRDSDGPMKLGVLLIGIAWLGAAAAIVARIGLRRPVNGRRGVTIAWAAAVLLVLAYAGWRITLWQLTSGTYVCVECGRTEEQLRFLGVTCSRTLDDDGS